MGVSIVHFKQKEQKMKSQVVKRININLTKEDIENLEAAKKKLCGDEEQAKISTSDTIREVLAIFASNN